MLTRVFMTVSALCVCFSISPASFAQSDTTGGRNTKKQSQPGRGGEEASDGLLAGPSVEQEAELGRTGGMMSPNNVDRRRANAATNVPLRQWLAAVRAVDLADEQRVEIDGLIADFQSRLSAFQREHGPTMRKLQQQARAERESGKQVDVGVREQLQKLEEQAPKQIEVQLAVWNVLTETQQSEARTRIAAFEGRGQAARRAASAQRGNQGASRPAGDRNNDTPNQGSNGEMMQPAGSGGRNTRKTGEGLEGEQAAPSGGMTDQPAAEPMPSPQSPARALQRRGAALARSNGVELDPPARQRLRFLLSRQTSSRAGNAPTSAEQRFEFDEAR